MTIQSILVTAFWTACIGGVLYLLVGWAVVIYRAWRAND